jgi:lipopolysaccharide transport system permease protein
MSEEFDSRPFIHIKPKRGLQFLDVREIAHYRDLFTFLVIRDIKVKYKQTVLGGVWAVIQPFFLMVVFTIFFGKFAKIPSDGIPYPIFNYSAMVAWTYFSTAISTSANSVVGSSNLVTKVYFPRILIPFTPVIAGLLDFAVAFMVLLAMMAYYHIYPTSMILFLPLLIILMILITSGIGMIFAALNAKYRDIKYMVPFLVQFWMFATPIVYPASLIPRRYLFIYALNPMTGVVEGFRSALLGTVAFPLEIVSISAVVSLGIFILGLAYFKYVERFFADII